MRVLIENEAGSRTKHLYDEQTFQLKSTRTVQHPYPFPYGFIIGTQSGGAPARTDSLWMEARFRIPLLHRGSIENDGVGNRTGCANHVHTSDAKTGCPVRGSHP